MAENQWVTSFSGPSLGFAWGVENPEPTIAEAVPAVCGAVWLDAWSDLRIDAGMPKGAQQRG